MGLPTENAIASHLVIPFICIIVEMTKGQATASQATASQAAQANQATTGKNITVSSSFVQRVIQYIGKEEIRQKLNEDIIDPLLNHIMKRVFPYIILTCVLFILLLLVVLLTLGIIIFHLRNPIAAVAVVGPS